MTSYQVGHCSFCYGWRGREGLEFSGVLATLSNSTCDSSMHISGPGSRLVEQSLHILPLLSSHEFILHQKCPNTWLRRNVTFQSFRHSLSTWHVLPSGVRRFPVVSIWFPPTSISLINVGGELKAACCRVTFTNDFRQEFQESYLMQRSSH